jgi:hypothetical protein
MAKYVVQEDPNFTWVKEIIITSDNDIDISSDVFNITVKDQLEYFISDYLNTGDSFDFEELLKEDTQPTLMISTQATVYEKMKCFKCGGAGFIPCSKCGGLGYTIDINNVKHECSCASSDTPYKEQCTDCSGDGLAHRVCGTEEHHGDDIIWSEVQTSNIFIYNNSDYDSLVKNGIQFWVDGVTKRTMHIRFSAKGKSSVNEDGYVIFNPKLNDYIKTGYVGFTIAQFNITLNSQEKLMFNVFNIPRLVTGNPEKLNPEAEEKPHILPSGTDRVDYDWNENEQGTDNLYLNNVSANAPSAIIYDQYPTDYNEIFWSTSAEVITGIRTPEYIVKSSAYLNDYLVNGETYDLLSGGYTSRNMHVGSAMIKSVLYNEYSEEEMSLPYDFGEEQLIEDVKFIESNGDYISDNLYVTEITQHLIDTTSSMNHVSNQVKLKVEI